MGGGSENQRERERARKINSISTSPVIVDKFRGIRGNNGLRSVSRTIHLGRLCVFPGEMLAFANSG